MIENITDQLEGFADEVRVAVEKNMKLGFTADQAIEIVRIAVEDIKAECMWHSVTKESEDNNV